MAPVIFTGVSMRAILLAAAAAIWAGNAGAAVYTLTFIADEPFCYEGDFCFEPRIELDLPSFKNVSISQLYKSSMEGWDYVYFPPVLQLPFDPGFAHTYFDLKTDQEGNITWLWFEWTDYLEYHTMSSTGWGVYYYPNGDSLYSSAGEWRVTSTASPVPLPASAPLLLGALGLAGFLKGRAKKRGPATSA